MLSYKEWRDLNENIGGSITIGLGQQKKVGEIMSRWDEMGLMKPMMKPMRAKKMFGDDGDAGAGMGGPPMPMMKKKKPMPRPDMDDTGDEDNLDHDEDDIDHDEDDLDHDENDLDNDEDQDTDDDQDQDDDTDMGGEDNDDISGDVPQDMPPPKKKGLMDKTKSLVDGAKMMHKGASKMKKSMKEMTREEEILASIRSQAGSSKFVRDEDGDFIAVKEDAIIPPSDPNADITTEQEPGPGELGYSPVTRIGSFTEWSSKYKK